MVLLQNFTLLLALRLQPSLISQPARPSQHSIKSGKDSVDDICLTPDCVMESAEYLSKANLSADPCKDFFEFACGKFFEEAAIDLVDEEEVYTFTPMMDKAKAVVKAIITEDIKPSDKHYLKLPKIFYKSCTDTATVERIGYGPYLNSSFAEEWPTLVGPRWNDSVDFSLAALVQRYALEQTMPLFEVSLSANPYNSSQRKIFAYASYEKVLKDAQYLEARNSTNLKVLETYYREMAIELGADPTIAAEDAVKFVDLETGLMEFMGKRPESKDVHEYSLRSLDQNYSRIGLPQTVRAMWRAINVTLDDDETILLYDHNLTFFSQFEDFLQFFTERDIRNLFGFYYAKIRTSTLTKRMGDISFPIEEITDGIEKQKPREKKCLKEVTEFFKRNLAKEFLRRMSFTQEGEKKACDMLEKIRTSFMLTLAGDTWMDNATKARSIEKVQAMNCFAGNPFKGYDDEEAYLEKLFENWNLSDIDYYGNNEEVLAGLFHLNNAKLYEVRSRKLWNFAVPPLVVNAYHLLNENNIYATAGILQPPVFSPHNQLAHNYGGMGSIFGHEFLHGFDPSGSKYDSNGDLYNWWSDDDKNSYTAKIECYKQHYGNFTFPQLKEENVTRSPDSNIGEIVADSGGVREAFRAYQDAIEASGEEEKKLPGLDLTANQRFFLAFGQTFCSRLTPKKFRYQIKYRPHPVSYYRIVGTLQNTPEFAQAFSCPLGSRMNPVDKCTLF